MYLLVTDETNKTGSDKVKFFIYGGLIVPLKSLLDLNKGVERIRENAGYKSGDKFKFDTRSRPKQVEIQKATQAKIEVIDLCYSIGCKFLAQASLHELIKDRSTEDQIEWAANTIFSEFNKYLEKNSSYGLCLMDNIPNKNQWKYLSEKFCFGLIFPDKKQRKLDRILVYGATCTNAGHVNSAMDIVLGTFRYCVNENLNDLLSKDMLKSVVRLMLHHNDGKSVRFTDYGLFLRPKAVNAEHHKKSYNDLKKRLNTLILSK